MRTRNYNHQCFYLGLVLALLLVLSGPLGAAAQESSAEQKGVFTGDQVGCKSKADLFAYYDASDEGNRSAMGEMISGRKCMNLLGRAYIPLRIGFVAAHVRVTYQGSDIELWVRSAAVVESPPPPRSTYFNF